MGVSQSTAFGKTHVEVHRSVGLMNEGAKRCRSMEIPRNNVPSIVDQWRSTGIICKMAWYGSREIHRNIVPSSVD